MHKRAAPPTSHRSQDRRAAVQRLLLRAGVVAPATALGATLLACAAFPGFNHATQYISELGGPQARIPALFNLGVLLAAVGAAAAGLGFAMTVKALRGSGLAGALTGLSFLLAAAGLAIAGVHPWPDPRHRAVNLALGIELAPLFLLWALWRVERLVGLRRFLVVVILAMLVLTILTKHLLWPGLVNDANVGWWERAFALTLISWAAVAAVWLERRLEAESPLPAPDPSEPPTQTGGA